jgi:predicted ribonuclease YlaK
MQNAHIDDDPILTLITRLGKGSKAVLSGDPDQCDIDARDSAFLEAINVFQNAPEASVIELKTIHRNPSINKFLTYFAEFRKKTNDI